tara:strand:- start:617 stop:778 length:162 start_codon:yes stop_codon:yes gene_type:complete
MLTEYFKKSFSGKKLFNCVNIFSGFNNMPINGITIPILKSSRKTFTEDPNTNK